jgi:hypothetical protein
VAEARVAIEVPARASSGATYLERKSSRAFCKFEGVGPEAVCAVLLRVKFHYAVSNDVRATDGFRQSRS